MSTGTSEQDLFLIYLHGLIIIIWMENVQHQEDSVHVLEL